MPRGLMFRRIIAGIVILLFVAAAIYSAANEFDKPIPLMIAAILGIAVLIEPVSIIWDRFIPDATTRRRKPSADAVRDADAYLEGRVRQFDDESKLFVELAGDTIIQTTFSSEAHQFEDIQKAVELHKGRFVLIGEPGAGKSTTLRQLMIQAIRDYRLKTNPRLPVEINLGLSETPTKTDELLEYWWDKWYLPSVPDEHIVNDRVWFFMDGLNEMPLDSREERAQALREFLDKHPTLPVIVTCRVRDYEDDEKLNLGLPMVRVHELDEGRIQEFITKRAAAADLWDKIRNNDALRRMADNPYKLVMLIAVYQAQRELPERLDELYGLYVKEAYKKYSQPDYAENRHHPLVRMAWPKLEVRLKRLAFLMIKDGKGTAASTDWARRKIGKRALMDGINLGVLLVDGEDVKFYHQSLHGFFAVEKLGKVLDTEGKSKRQINQIKALIRQIGDLGEAGTPAVDPLILALQDTDSGVRWEVADALAKIGTPAVDPLILALQDTDSVVRWAAADALAKIADPRAVDPLVLALQDTDSDVRQRAADALAKIGTPAVDPLVLALQDAYFDVRRQAATALGKIADPRAVDPLVRTLSDTYSVVRGYTADALGKIADPRAVDSLISALQDSNSYVRQAAATALRKIGTPEALAAVEQWERKQKSGG